MMLRRVAVLPQPVQSAGKRSIQVVLEPGAFSFADSFSTQLLHDILMHASSSVVLLTTVIAQISLSISYP